MSFYTIDYVKEKEIENLLLMSIEKAKHVQWRSNNSIKESIYSKSLLKAIYLLDLVFEP